MPLAEVFLKKELPQEGALLRCEGQDFEDSWAAHVLRLRGLLSTKPSSPRRGHPPRARSLR